MPYVSVPNLEILDQFNDALIAAGLTISNAQGDPDALIDPSFIIEVDESIYTQAYQNLAVQYGLTEVSAGFPASGEMSLANIPVGLDVNDRRMLIETGDRYYWNPYAGVSGEWWNEKGWNDGGGTNQTTTGLAAPMKRFNGMSFGGNRGIPAPACNLRFTRFSAVWEGAQVDPGFEIRTGSGASGFVLQPGTHSALDVTLDITDPQWLVDLSISTHLSVYWAGTAPVNRPQFKIQGYQVLVPGGSNYA